MNPTDELPEPPPGSLIMRIKITPIEDDDDEKTEEKE